MKPPGLTALRLFCTFLVLLLLCAIWWSWGVLGGADSTELPPLRIVCHGGDKVMRCPSDCEVGADGKAECRCQDFYYRKGEEPLAFSHTLCR